MEGNLILGVVLGGSLALANGLLSFRTLRQAAHVPVRQFAALVFKGMGLRMLLVLVVVALVLWQVPVHLQAFVWTLVAGLVLGLVLEVWMLMRTLTTPPAEDETP